MSSKRPATLEAGLSILYRNFTLIDPKSQKTPYAYLLKALGHGYF